MKKESGLILIIGASIIAVYYLFFKKNGSNKKMEEEKKEFTPQDAENALLVMAGKYGKERAQLLEKIMRWETGHFKSGQYKKGGSAGMEDGKWFNLPKASYTTYKMYDNIDKGLKTFIKWNSVLSFLEYLNDYINRYDGNFARWNTTNQQKQVEYKAKVLSVKNRTIV
jgi:hypothetical protein